MSKPLHNEQRAIQYLLGSLSEAEMENLDALSVTDNEFAGELTAAEHDLVDAYVHGELTGDTLKRFESHYLASPLRREKVEFARTFQLYANGNTSGAPDHSLGEASYPRRSAAGFFSILNIFRNQSPALRWSFAAAGFLLLALGAWWTIGNRSGQNNQAIATFVLAPSMRGNSPIPTLSIPHNTTEVRIQLELESEDYSSYSVALTDESGSAKLWQSGILKATAKGDGKHLEVRLPTRLLRSKLYLLVVSGLNSDGIAEILTNYPFRTDVR